MGQPLQLFYCDQHHFPLSLVHRFPLPKYRLLREELTRDPRFHIRPAPLAGRESLLRIHDADYVHHFLEGTLDPATMRRIGFPWSGELARRTLASVGGTLEAARTALESGFGGTLAGGTHHAFRNEGAGFCVFNDLALAIAWMQDVKAITRVAVIDLDVHQGDGTAAIFAGNLSVFTLSLHGAKNFPFRKQKSVLDVELEDGTNDAAYLAALKPALQQVWDFEPEITIFQAGVDALATDRLGRLSLSPEGMAARDALVIETARARGVPLVITLGGGYSEPIELTVAAHATTFRTAADAYCA